MTDYTQEELRALLIKNGFPKRTRITAYPEQVPFCAPGEERACLVHVAVQDHFDENCSIYVTSATLKASGTLFLHARVAELQQKIKATWQSSRALHDIADELDRDDTIGGPRSFDLPLNKATLEIVGSKTQDTAPRTPEANVIKVWDIDHATRTYKVATDATATPVTMTAAKLKDQHPEYKQYRGLGTRAQRYQDYKKSQRAAREN